MKRLVYFAILATAVLSPRAAASQDAPERPTSLSIRPFGGGTIGVWHWFSPRLEAGLEVGGSVAGREGDDGIAEENRSAFSIEPVLKLYGAPRGELRPYGAGTVFFNSQRYDFGDQVETSMSNLGVSLGGGLEWSPAPRVRIGGHAGVSVAKVGGEQTTMELGTRVQRDIEGWEAGTFTTGITFYYSF